MSLGIGHAIIHRDLWIRLAEDFSDHIFFFSKGVWDYPDLFYVKFKLDFIEDCILPYYYDLSIIDDKFIKFGPFVDT